jgi:hypothetical protein
MESLPLMLQAALLLLGCALSRYLWEISITVASVVLGVTSLGGLFYIFIIIAGASPTAVHIKHPDHASSATWGKESLFRCLSPQPFRESEVIKTITIYVRYYRPWWSRDNIRSS